MSFESLRNILVIGKGGREHAIGWKLAGSRHVEQVYFAPGNAGTSQVGRNLDIDPLNFPKLAQFAKDHKTFTVVGPEDPIDHAIENFFAKDKLPIFAPSCEAARLETSKAWAIYFMRRHGVPHPDSKVFITSDDALRFMERPPWKEMVVKADGLASGKGVKLPTTIGEAKQAIIDLMILDKCGEAGDWIVIQEKLKGKEVSIFAFCDGKTILPILPIYDYKRALDNDEGLNTGGMGSYAQAPSMMSPKITDTIYKTILMPTVKGMKEEGHPFKGMLYVGLMLTDQGPKVLEYNVRFGDPETQSLVRLLASDLGPLLLSCVEGTLSSRTVQFTKGAAVCVVLCSQGYPETYKKGTVIEGLDKIKDPSIKVFHAGTIVKDGRIVTDGGRVLGVTAYGNTLSNAVEKAYGVIGNPLKLAAMHYRKDIGLVK